ncbi:TetR/AcrR family transcriptional regulator [Rhodococcus sp. 3Y1]
MREASAQRTRELIRDAATALFVRDGYVSATVKQIAASAGVADRTVFTAFPGGKLEIFEAALAAALDAEGFHSARRTWPRTPMTFAGSSPRSWLRASDCSNVPAL